MVWNIFYIRNVQYFLFTLHIVSNVFTHNSKKLLRRCKHGIEQALEVSFKKECNNNNNETET